MVPNDAKNNILSAQYHRINAKKRALKGAKCYLLY